MNKNYNKKVYVMPVAEIIKIGIVGLLLGSRVNTGLKPIIEKPIKDDDEEISG